MLITPAILWLAYVVFIGGDVFPGWRHFVPVLVVIALALAEGTRWLIKQSLRVRWRILLLVITAAGLVWFFQNQVTNPENQRAIKERWEFDGQVVGTMLKSGFGETRPLVAVTAAGCIPYWSGLPSIDMMGLNDYYLPRHRPDDFGQGWIGHKLRDDEYVLWRNPDLIIFHMGGNWMYEMEQFRDRYLLCHFEGRIPYTYRTAIWVNRTSEKIGIRRNDTSISIPAYLLNGNHKTTAYLNGDRFVTPVSIEQSAWISGLRIRPGRWRVDVFASVPVVASVTVSDDGTNLVLTENPLVLEVANAVSVRLTVTPSEEGVAEVDRIVLHRLTE